MSTGLQMRIIDRAIGKLPNEVDITTPFLHSFLRKTDSELTKLYTKAKSYKAELLGFLALLDNRIKEIEILTPNEEPILYLTLQDGKSFPINMFGDAVRKVVEILLVILNTSNSILLIDEIENGVHYTKQKNLWNILFEISERQRVQIFATTHSREMITAFANAANTKTDVSATYFQMYLSGLSSEIVAAPYNIEELLYALNNNIALRGEIEV
jgi:AAA15 family ATPase/GTPase